MAVNPDILSEIKHRKGLDEVSRELLTWAVNFEESNIEMDQPRFKKEYVSKLDELISKEGPQQSATD